MSDAICPCMVVRCLLLRLAFVVCCCCTHNPIKHVRYPAAAARCNALCYIWSMIMAPFLSASFIVLLSPSRCVLASLLASSAPRRLKTGPP